MLITPDLTYVAVENRKLQSRYTVLQTLETMKKLVVALKNIIATFSSTTTVVNKLIFERSLYHLDFIFQDLY